MSWQTPSFVEINMSAEIGAYQDDTDEERNQDRDPSRYFNTKRITSLSVLKKVIALGHVVLARVRIVGREVLLDVSVPPAATTVELAYRQPCASIFSMSVRRRPIASMLVR